jgi:hypothetical protein
MKRPKQEDFTDIIGNTDVELDVYSYSAAQGSFIDSQQEEIKALRSLCKKFLHPRYYHNLPSKFKLK